jgi:hypothetical protein
MIYLYLYDAVSESIGILIIALMQQLLTGQKAISVTKNHISDKKLIQVMHRFYVALIKAQV